MTLANVPHTQMNTTQFNIPFKTADLLKPTVQDYILSDYIFQLNEAILNFITDT